MRRLGPGFLVTAAFIGPGTITTATVAGASYGFALVWALVFSIATTLVLQEMAARLGIVTRLGLARVLRDSIGNPWARWTVLILLVIAIGFGNAAYQTGNLLGAALGAGSLLNVPVPVLAAAIAGAASALLATGLYRLIEGVLIFLVFAMSVVFMVAMLVQPPDFLAMVKGLVPSALPPGAGLAVMAIVGTTVVPYNLFLHSSAVQARWGPEVDHATAIGEARADLALSVGIGGLITLAVMSTAATAFFGKNVTVTGASIVAQLEPALGPLAGGFVACGLMAAGLTSAITAPLAAAYAICGAFGWPADMKSLHFRMVWAAVMAFGLGFAVLETSPVQAIVVAQAANALALPVVALALLWTMNRPLLGDRKNGVAANVLGGVFVAVTVGLGVHRLLVLA